ncbi:MAG: FAD-dependent oxidoreductase [Lentisphaeria bacterium]|nr:FAD-dependent oxidoreductase [Lentisphaeria bacterium]
MKHYDIAVCGAGIAGVAAALAGARRGKKVVLVEKQCIIGGLATSGLIYIYLPISDDRGKVIASGITKELLTASQEYGPFALDETWGGIPGGDSGIGEKRYSCCFSPAGYALTLDRLLREAGVEVLLETTVTGVHCDADSRLTGMTLFCGAAHWNISAGIFIDASGGAFMLQMAGEKVFSDVNFVIPWIIENNPDKAGAESFYFSGDLHIAPVKDFSSDNTIESMLTVADMQKFIKLQYQEIRRYFDDFVPEKRKRCYPVHIPAMPQIRKIARIDAMSLIKEGDGGIYCSDSIGVAADWRRLDAPAWETPFGALIPKNVKGVLAAGRCINTSGDAWEIFRVIPAAAMTGEASGVAAAMACDRSCDPRDIPVAELQKELLKNDVILHISDGR